MPRILIPVLLAAGLLGCRPAPETAAPSSAAPEPEAEVVAVVAFTEGPAEYKDGSVFFSEMRSGRTLRWRRGAGVETFREDSNGANGLVFDAEWRLIAAERDRITRTDVETGAVEVLARRTAETPLEGPNDVTVDGRGRIYFTDHRGAAIYRIDRDGKVSRILGAPDVEVPNGLAVSPDDRILYYVESNGKEGGARAIKAFDLAADGTVSNGRVFHNFYPGRSADGISIDSRGNVYAAAGLNRPRGTSETLDTKAGIHVFAPDGKLLDFYPVWEDTITNCAFGGENLETLYVTAGKNLLAIRTGIPGTRR
jgi:gluconolactonase